jgi:hypothetical protein
VARYKGHKLAKALRILAYITKWAEQWELSLLKMKVEKRLSKKCEQDVWSEYSTEWKSWFLQQYTVSCAQVMGGAD